MPPSTTTTTIYYPGLTSWPSWIAEPRFPIAEVTMFPALKTQKDAAYVQQRKKWTVPKRTWSLDWDDKVSMKEADFQSLLSFFIAKQGSSFFWTHPATNVTYTVMFDQDELETSILYPGYRTVNVKLREV